MRIGILRIDPLRGARWLAGGAIFLGAFLLFSVQPLAARALLPWYGGAPMVWAVALFFFQTALLGGYLYAHLLATRVPRRRQVAVHAALVVAALLFFLPPLPAAGWAPAGGEAPGPRILLTLLAGPGLPFVLGAATTPLVSAWLAGGGGRKGASGSPYRFFAVSNTGSLLGLLLYPVAVEPFLGVAAQAGWWTAGFALLGAATVGAGALLTRRAADPPPPAAAPAAGTPPTAAADSPPPAPDPAAPTPTPADPAAQTQPPSRPRLAARLAPALLAAAASFALVSVTTHLTRDVAAAPFLWIAPLAVYLVTFVLAFGAPDRFPRRALTPAVFLAAAACLLVWLADITTGLDRPLLSHAAAGLAFLFAAGWTAHAEIARRRPAPARLTGFYLSLTAGGAAGGLSASLLSPLLFPNTWEYPLALVLGAAAPFAGAASASRSLPRAALRGALAGVAGLALAVTWLEHRRPLHASRNFYGAVRVMEDSPDTPEWRRDLWHGGIGHGSQRLAPGRRREPMLYYYEGTGVKTALDRHPKRRAGQPLSVGILGLGAGSLAARSRSGDRFRFYELDPQVERVARRYFTYLDDAAGEVEVVLGDGRLSLEREEAAGEAPWDVLVLDAFTGDAVPVHLLTAEAFDLYRRRLAPGGVIAAHISNRHVDLAPVIRAQALALGAISLLTETDPDPEAYRYETTWALITWSSDFVTDPSVLSRARPFSGEAAEPGEAYRWTDDYSNLFLVLR